MPVPLTPKLIVSMPVLPFATNRSSTAWGGVRLSGWNSKKLSPTKAKRALMSSGRAIECGREPEIREVAYMMPDDWHPFDEMDRELERDYGK